MFCIYILRIYTQTLRPFNMLLVFEYINAVVKVAVYIYIYIPLKIGGAIE